MVYNQIKDMDKSDFFVYYEDSDIYGNVVKLANAKHLPI